MQEKHLDSHTDKELEPFHSTSGKRWDGDIPIIAAINWSPPKIKIKEEWNKVTNYYFYGITKNTLEIYSCFYSNGTLSR